MNDLFKTVNELPLIVKVLLCIPALDLFYGICRILWSVSKNDGVWILLAVLTVFPGAFFIWILDVFWVLTKGHAFLMGEQMFS